MAKVGEHAVVLGASMGGLSAARVLADFYETVTVVERDILPQGAANRRGVPQGKHGHAILGRGLAVLGELFPGFIDELHAAGVPSLDYHDLSEAYMSFGGRVTPRSGGFTGMPAVYFPSRPLLEGLVRERLRRTRNVTLLDGFDATTMMSCAETGRVTGVKIRAHQNGQTGRELKLNADLVVDATGRAARTPAFLESLGYGRPPEDSVKVRVMYSSQLLRLPPGTLREKIILVGAEPGRPTGMALFGYEDGTWMFTVFGMAGAEPPAELAQMREFVRGIVPDHIVDALAVGAPLGEVCQFRYPESRWRRYDKLNRFPDGLVVLGDAICSFNPVYGQGMTVAMLQAQSLGECLQKGSNDLARRYFRAAAKPIGVAWQFAVGGDLSLPEVQAKRPLATRLGNRYIARLQTVAQYDMEVTETFFRIIGLLDPPSRLLRPKMLVRAALHRRRAVTPHEEIALTPN